MLLLRVCTALLILHVARGQHVLNCSHVRNLLRNRGVTELTDGTSNGSGVCRVGVGCCGAEWDQGLLTESRSYLHSRIKAFTASALSQLSQHYTQVQGVVLSLLRSAKSNVFAVFRDNYPRSSRRFSRLISIFFNRLERFLQADGSTSSPLLIRGSVEQFLDRLTVSVYDSVSSRRAIRGGRLQRCATLYRLSDLNQHLHRLRSGLGGVLEPVKLYLNSLKLTLQVLESCSQLAFTDSCDRGVARLQLCPLCWGLDWVTACPGFCHNVVSGCLAPLRVLDSSWKALLAALRQQQVQVRRAVFLDSGSFVRVDRIVLEVVFVMWNNADDVRNQVNAHCINMSVAKPSTAPGWSSEIDKHVEELGEDFESSWSELADAHPPHPTLLNNQLNNFNRAAAEMMSLFADISKGICSSTEQGGSLCWNGESLGRYSERVVDASPDSQWTNPEVRVPPLMELPGIGELLRTLRLAREMLEFDVRLAPSVGGLQSSGDGEWVEGSGEGSGDWIYGLTDDEDASGSGAGPDHNSGFSDDEDGTVWRIHSGIGDSYVPVKSTDTPVSNPSSEKNDNVEGQEKSTDGQVTGGAALLTPPILWIALQVVFL